MQRTILFSLFTSSIVSALPTLDISALVPKDSAAKTFLEGDEVFVYNNGTPAVLHYEEFVSLLEADGILPSPPPLDESWLNWNASGLKARDGCKPSYIVTDKTENFVDWDVQMSPVIIGAGTGIDLYVANSYTVSNSITVSVGLDYTFAKDVLSGSLGVDYSHTWTTSSTIQTKATVVDGKTGVMITKPYKTRKYGRAFCGKAGSLTEAGTWTADSYKSQDYNGISWVSGAITACIKNQRTLPLSRCTGSGNFI